MKKIIFSFLYFLFAVINLFTQWQPDYRLTNDPSNSVVSSGTFSTRSVATSGSFVHVVWREFRDGNNEIYYKRSDDGGATWESDIRLTDNSFSSLNSSVSVSGSVVHVVWNDNRDGNNEIYYKHSNDDGVTWGPDTRLTNDPARSETPSISSNGSEIHIVWSDQRDGNLEIYYKQSFDGGLTWGGDIRITNAAANSFVPSIFVSGSVVHVAWNDNRNGNQEIFYKNSTDMGVSWGTDTRLTNVAISFNPSVSVTGSSVHVVWYDTRDGNQEIYYKNSTDMGASWGLDTRLSNNPGLSRIPQVTVSGSAVHVVWHDNSDGNSEIYYKCSVDNGVTWESDVRLTDNVLNSANPSLCVSGAAVNVVWNDNRDGNNEIYYKQNPTGNPMPCNISVNAGEENTIYLGYGIQTATLTASTLGGNGPYQYLWSPGNETTQSITVTPQTTTNYSVRVTDVNSCTAEDTAAVNVYDVRCGNNGENILICHKGKTICVGITSVAAHLSHGDVLDSCGGGLDNISNYENVPEEYSISQNYPNPFNPSTSLKFSLPERGNVSLILYNAAGEEISVLVSGELEAGNHTAAFNGENFASGIYFYRITVIPEGKTSVGFTETRKMLLVK